MLVAPPSCLVFDAVPGASDLPRVISEIRKPSPIAPRDHVRPRISGDLLVICANEKRWWPRRVMVRGGQLLVGAAHAEGALGSLRLPLRHLSLAAGPLPNSLALYRGQNIVLTLQTASERAFDLWVKTIAIELIRQTPLDAIKYLDILTITECWNRRKKDSEKDWNSNFVGEPAHAPTCSFCCKVGSRRPPSPPPRACFPHSDEPNVDALLKRCQNSDNYVSVKEKLVLFESLCRLSSTIRSSEDISYKSAVEDSKRAVSMHDLSNCLGSTPGVRQICKYFENKTNREEAIKYGAMNQANKRLVHSDLQLNSVKKSGAYRFNVRNNYPKISCT